MFDDYIKTNTTIPASELLVELHVPELPEHWGVQVKHKLRCALQKLLSCSVGASEQRC